MSRKTDCVRAAIDSDVAHNAVVPPLQLSTTFRFSRFGEKGAYDYTRSGNPTRDQLAAAIADLEGGAGAVSVASGMAAITLVCQLLGPDDLIVVPHDCYGGSYRLFTTLAQRGQFRLAVIDQKDPAALAQALEQNPAIVWIETPSNPLLRLVDVSSIADAAHKVGSLVVVDNTFLSPTGQLPFELRADLVVHSTTKYINGHSDVVGGAVVAKTDELVERLAWWANCLGLTSAPFDCWLTLRGLRTLHARTRALTENALEIARFLETHPAIDTVHYPGLESHADHDLAVRQQRHFGGMISFEVSQTVCIEQFATSLRYFSLAESLGGVESLIAHPATMTHAAMDEEARSTAGISDRLLRLSIGVEDGADLIEDLRCALETARRKKRKVA